LRANISVGGNVTQPPKECLEAQFFTESWRLRHNGDDFRGSGNHSFFGYACDLHQIQWFRFSGAAGSRLLNTCPPPESCGTSLPIWSDADMPDSVGVVTNVEAYAVSYSGDCKSITYPLSVMRCSRSVNDFIYKLVNPVTNIMSCISAFCGMR